MTSESLSYINSLLTEAKINYSFVRWNGELIFPYWIGEYSEVDSINEDGMTENDFILTGTTEESWSQLQEEKEKIEKLFRNRTTVLDSGIGISISLDRALIVPTETEQLKRIQINLSVKEWRNN